METCPECGALERGGKDCWHMLGEIIAWESADPELFKRHFLTVASYNLQHPAQFTDEAVAGLRTAFIRHLDEGLPVAQIRAMNAKAHAGHKRVRKPEGERHAVRRAWPITIADVYIPDHPQDAAGRVIAWAGSIRAAL